MKHRRVHRARRLQAQLDDMTMQMGYLEQELGHANQQLELADQQLTQATLRASSLEHSMQTHSAAAKEYKDEVERLRERLERAKDVHDCRVTGRLFVSLSD